MEYNSGGKIRFIERHANMKKYTTVIFDLDGTLLDTLYDLCDGVNIALRAYHMPEKTIDEVRMAVGNGVEKLMERTVPGGHANPQFDECLARFRTEYAKIAADHTKPYDGIPAMLDRLNADGYHLAVVSNKFHDATVALVHRYFPVIHAVAGEREELGIRKKPCPDTVFAIVREFGVTPAECVYVGDSDVDIETAKNAHMDCISVAWGFRDTAFLREHGATRIVSAPEELYRAIVGE